MKKQEANRPIHDRHYRITHSQPKTTLPRRDSKNIVQQSNSHMIEGSFEFLHDKNTKPHRHTPIIATANEAILTDVDLRSLIEIGLSIIRFRMNMLSMKDRLKLLKYIEDAEAWMCEKYGINTWPLAKCLDLPNATIRTGYIDESIKSQKIIMKENSIVTVTSDVRYWNKCTVSLLYIDDSYTIQHFTPGLEITLFCRIVLQCIEIIDKKTAKFIVTIGGEFTSHQYVCVRGIKYYRPPLLKRDLELIKFAEEYRFDVLCVYTVRSPSTILMVKRLLAHDYKPLILSVICDQQGLDCVQDIITVCFLKLIYYINVIDDLKDDMNMVRERRALLVRANSLACRFAKCTAAVKNALFKAYCTTLYAGALWAIYTQRSLNALRVQYSNTFRVVGAATFTDARVDSFMATYRIGVTTEQNTCQPQQPPEDDCREVSDGIILARDLLSFHLTESNRLFAIQMHLAGKCKSVGKPFFLSGGVLLHTLESGMLYGSELSDVTNGVIQGAGFLLRDYKETKNLVDSLNTIDNVCREVESTMMPEEFFRLINERKAPVNAADAALMAGAFMATQVRAVVIIVSTVTGKTAVKLSNLIPHIIIVAVTRNQHVARKLQLYKGVVAVVYNDPPKYPYIMEMEARVKYAVNFCVKMDILQYMDTYVTLRKSKSECSFCDHVSSSFVSYAAAKDKVKSRSGPSIDLGD